jgi:hypothetical protein
VYSLIVDPSAPHTIYAGTNSGGVWTSTDGGVTWQSTGLSTGTVSSLAVDSAGLVYAGTNSAGAQASRDRGATWTILRAGIDGVNKFGVGVWIDPSNDPKILSAAHSGTAWFGRRMVAHPGLSLDRASPGTDPEAWRLTRRTPSEYTPAGRWGTYSSKAPMAA